MLQHAEEHLHLQRLAKIESVGSIKVMAGDQRQRSPDIVIVHGLQVSHSHFFKEPGCRQTEQLGRQPPIILFALESCHNLGQTQQWNDYALGLVVKRSSNIRVITAVPGS